MGSGNRIAADISDIVLLDNNFTYITRLILTGQSAFDNIKKMFLYFTVVSAFSQAFTSVLSTIIGLPSPFSIYTTAIVCVITDAIPAVAFIFEKSTAQDNMYQKVNNSLTNFNSQSLNECNSACLT